MAAMSSRNIDSDASPANSTRIDGRDFFAWQRNFRDSQIHVRNLPEPSAFWNCSLVAVGWFVGRRTWRGCDRRRSFEVSLLLLVSLILGSTHTIAAPEVGRTGSTVAEASQQGSDEEQVLDSKTKWGKVPEILNRIVPPQCSAREFVITDYGAASGEELKCTGAFRDAIARLGSTV